MMGVVMIKPVCCAVSSLPDYVITDWGAARASAVGVGRAAAEEE
jgi:hypothetical protein